MMERYSVKTNNASLPSGGVKKDLRQSRIGSSSSMDSTNSSSMYRKSYPNSDINASFSSSVAGSIQDDTMNDQCSLTQAELEEYSRSYFGQQVFHHQKQSSYAQSEGYHSYVSSSDSSSATPFLDRLRQESELLSRSSHWSQSDLQSASSANNIADNNSSESTSSSETLKWLGSMSDVSVSSHATNSSNLSGSASSSQLIVHSSRVRTPKRHNSESVLYMTEEQIAKENKIISPRERSSRSNNRLFPISTYTEPTNDSQPITPTKTQNGNNNWQSVADRISELERQQTTQSSSIPQNQKYTFLDPSKTTRVPNPALKAFQKNAVQSYFERQQTTAKEKEAAKNLINSQQTINNPPRPHSLPIQSNTPKSVAHSRSSLPNNFSQVNSLSSNNKSPQQSPVMLAPISQCSITTTTTATTIHSTSVCTTPTTIPSPIISRPTSDTPKILTSPSYQATFHQAATVYNIPMVATAASLSQEHYGRSYNGNIYLTNKQLAEDDVAFLQSANESGVPPPPPRRSRPMMPVRRTSSASEYAAIRDQNIQKDLLGPIVMGPIISLDDWVPERPPKNPALRIPSPELPPPPPPVTVIEDEIPITNQDEPLPPPPPELLRHMRQLSEPDSKSTTPSRRNSFAGSTTKKPLLRTSTLENLSPTSVTPPLIPKKPTSVETLHPKRPTSSLAKHPPPIIVKPYKIIANGKMEPPTSLPIIQQQHSAPIQERYSDTRPAIRKRLHNSQSPLELTSPTSKIIASPPPLKPRISTNQQLNDSNHRSSSSLGNRIRCNSKASYLPRQSREKLNSDPDHGSYKLTLTSNEDSINHNNVFHENNLPSKCSNLPDVLPVGAKVHPSSPRYGSNNNLHSNHIKSAHTAPALHSYPMKSMFNFNINHNRNSTPSPTSPSTYGRNPNESISPKYMSQSNIDLKKTHILANADTNKISFLENDAVDLTTNTQINRQSPYTLRNEFVNRKISFEDRTNTANQFVQMAVNRNNSSTPTCKDEKLIRKDSLKENIDKITQLQTKLMSAHLSESEKNIANLCRDLNVRNDMNDKHEGGDLMTPVNQSGEMEESERNNHTEFEFERDVETSGSQIVVAEISETTISPVSNNPEEDGSVQVVQRTEIVLRLNAPTSEAASQTDGYESMSSDCEDGDDITIHCIKLRHFEDLDCEKLSKDLVSQLSPTDRLHHILAPKSFKSSSDYVSGLYNPYIAPRIIKKDVATSTPERSPNGVKSPTTTSPTSTNYFQMPESANQPKSNTTSIRFNREIKTLINGDSCDLTKQKEELVSRISKKLNVLANEQTTIIEESNANDMLGNDVTLKVGQKLRPTDASKFRSYVDDVGHITMLLLSLSGRLAKTENTLGGSYDGAEKKILEAKRDRLIEQLEEAKKLKVDIDRRGNLVCKTLEKHLSIEEYADYDYFINMKAKLIVDAREIADKIKLGEEQLSALKDTLVHSEC